MGNANLTLGPEPSVKIRARKARRIAALLLYGIASFGFALIATELFARAGFRGHGGHAPGNAVLGLYLAVATIGLWLGRKLGANAPRGKSCSPRLSGLGRESPVFSDSLCLGSEEDWPAFHHPQHQTVRARFNATNSIVVLATLGVVLLTVISIVLQLMTWVVLIGI